MGKLPAESGFSPQCEVDVVEEEVEVRPVTIPTANPPMAPARTPSKIRTKLFSTNLVFAKASPLLDVRELLGKEYMHSTLCPLGRKREKQEATR